jgi:chorismate mutase
MQTDQDAHRASVTQTLSKRIRVMRKVAQTPDNYNDWMEQQARESYISDQRRYVPAPAPTTKHYADETGRVLLGQRTIADAQRQVEDDAGGLVAYMMNRGR